MTSKFMSPPPVRADSSPVALSFPDNCDGRVAVISLNAPDKLNALGWAGYKMITRCLEWIAQQPELVVTIVTGKGRYFSAGADVKDPSRTLPPEVEKADPNTEEGKAVIGEFYANRANAGQGRLASALRSHPKVLIGAMNGPAVGLSAAILGHCDLVYAYDDFFFFTPFMSLSLVAEGLTSVTFVQKMGLGRATEALLEGRKMLAPELKEAGFITRLYTKPAGFDGKDKLATPPILDDVLANVREKMLPPNASPFSILYTKKLLSDAAYNYQGVDAANNAELVSFPGPADSRNPAWHRRIRHAILTTVLFALLGFRKAPRSCLPPVRPRSALSASPAVPGTSCNPLVLSSVVAPDPEKFTLCKVTLECVFV